MPEMLGPFRIGHGYDLHRLKKGGRLVLGGVVVSEEMSPVAHSDGDVVMHALIDALLGAMGWGDIGEHFPNDEARWKGAASGVFLDLVVRRVKKAGYRVGNADVTILVERPRLGEHKQAMARNLEKLVGGTVNVKAGTNEGCDAIGRGEAIGAHAVVLVVRIPARSKRTRGGRRGRGRPRSDGSTAKGRSKK